MDTYGGTIAVRSTLVQDWIAFGSDGLARTGGALANDREFAICANNLDTRNRRQIVIGAGSRVSTQIATGDC